MQVPEDKKQFILLPVNAKRQYKKLIAKQDDLMRESETKGFNQLFVFFLNCSAKKDGLPFPIDA